MCNVCGRLSGARHRYSSYCRNAATDLATTAVRLNSDLLATEMIDFGIDVNCAPVADVHYTTGSYANSYNPRIAVTIIHAVCEGFLAGGRADGDQAYPRPWSGLRR